MSTYVRGSHFDFSQGRLRLRRATRTHLPVETGDAFLGVESESVELGLDLRRDGKYQSTLVGAGLAYILPIALKASTEVRFRRVGE